MSGGNWQQVDQVQELEGIVPEAVCDACGDGPESVESLRAWTRPAESADAGKTGTRTQGAHLGPVLVIWGT